MNVQPLASRSGAGVYAASNTFLAGALGPGAVARRDRVIPADAPRPVEAERAGVPRADRESPFALSPSTTSPPRAPRADTAYQRNADGDEAILASRREELTSDERKTVEKLRKRDAEVRAHEQAHVAAAGRLHRSGPHYTYTTGPDARQYATAGHVNIDTTPAETPDDTISKARQIRSAALAPSEPSSADRAVAVEAARLEAQARAELKAARTSSGAADAQAPSPPSASVSRPASPDASRLAATTRVDLFA